MDEQAQLKHHEALRKVVNATGFPLQLGIKRKVEETRYQHGWDVVTMEHPWQHPETKETGYADLVLGMRCNTQIMVIECKRMLDSEWIFLCPAEREPKQWSTSKTWLTIGVNGKFSHFGWDSMHIDPVGYRSEFCGIPKMDNKATTMLERISSELVDATEAIAHQERTLYANKTLRRAYHPVIVTSAPLKACKFNPADINETGEITKCVFEEVPFIRFHKCLGGRLGDFTKSDHLYNVLQEHERTVHVVNAEQLDSFLRQWDYAFPDMR